MRWTSFFYRFFLRASLIMPVNVCVCVFESIYVCFFCIYFYFYAFVSLDVWMKETFLVAFSAKMIMCASFTSLANSTRIDANLQEIIRIWALKRDIDKTLLGYYKYKKNTVMVAGQYGFALECQARAKRKRRKPFRGLVIFPRFTSWTFFFFKKINVRKF